MSGAEPKIEVIGRLQKAIEARDMPTVLSYFDPNIEYHYHVGTRPLKGIDWVEKFFTKYWTNNSSGTWVLQHWAERDGRLLAEGREEYVNADGVLVQHPYMGIIEFGADGKITGWRDYFQMQDPNAGK
ncbi:MAG: nuclear transport factor 2 family protein [Brevundimonas sp.]|uniref:nuclear transport factor 2 family protein n=1 Tax=Brevundimonas sp. TaxID=1871086 RepID=UPI0040349825